jgi:hypothetical protein
MADYSVLPAIDASGRVHVMIAAPSATGISVRTLSEYLLANFTA